MICVFCSKEIRKYKTIYFGFCDLCNTHYQNDINNNIISWEFRSIIKYDTYHINFKFDKLCIYKFKKIFDKNIIYSIDNYQYNKNLFTPQNTKQKLTKLLLFL